jgi:MinD-like ATPase involved in chromosome partitioning or flagellar assembly
MTTIALASLKHSPGVTTLSIALALVIADRDEPTLLVDVDPFGGDIAAYVGLAVDPGLGTLAAAHRRAERPLDLSRHVAELPNGGAVIVNPGVPSQIASILDALTPRLTTALEAIPGIAILDCGRLVSGSPAVPAIERADHLLVMIRPTLAGVALVQAQGSWLRALGPNSVSLVLLGDRPYGVDDVRAVTGLEVAGVVPTDQRGAVGVCGALPRRAAKRTPLARSARAIADGLLAPRTAVSVQESVSST